MYSLKTARACFVSAIASLMLLSSLLGAAPSVLFAAAAIPAVIGPIPVTGDSYPLDAANHSVAPQDLSKFGYVEEEYFVSGAANVYDLDSSGKAKVRTANAPYTTRDPREASCFCPRVQRYRGCGNPQRDTDVRCRLSVAVP